MKGEDLKSTAPRWKLLKIEDVQQAPHNKPTRVTPRTIQPLAESMARIGLIYPILVDPTNTLIEGHRRLAAAKSLGWQTIAAIVVDQAPAAQVYAEVNANARKIRGHEHLHAWLVNPQAVTGKLAKELLAAKEEFGLTMLRRLAEKGMSPRVVYIARRVARYCGCTAKESLRWLIEVALIGPALKAMATGVDAKLLAQAVKKNKPL